MTTLELWFMIFCAAGFVVCSWLQRIEERKREDFERTRRNYGRNPSGDA